MRRTFEHQVLEIVRQAGRFSRVVLSTDAHCDISLYARLPWVLRHKHLQPVGKGVDFSVKGVTRHRIVGILGGGHGPEGRNSPYGKRKPQFSCSHHRSL